MKLKSLLVEIDEDNPEILHTSLKSGAEKFISGMQQISQDMERNISDKQKIKDFLSKEPEVKKLVGNSIPELNEVLDPASIMGIISFIMSIPMIISLVGVVVDHIEKKLGNSKRHIGKHMEKLGHTLHDDMVKMIGKGLIHLPKFKFLPKRIQEKISSIIYIIIVISLSIGSGGISASSALDIFPDMIKGSAELTKSGITNITHLINAIKGGEVGSIIKDVLLQLLKT